MCGRTWQAPSSAHSWRSASTQVVIAIGPSTASTMSARLIDGARAGEAEAAAGAARRFEQARGGSRLTSFCAVGSGMPVSAGKVGRTEPRAAAMARGGGHHHDGIIGKAGQAHQLPIGLIRSDCASGPAEGPKSSVALTRCRDACHSRRAMALYPLVRPLAFALDAERAHRLTIAALKRLPAGRPAAPDPRRCRSTSRGSISPIRSAWPPGSTRMPRCSGRCSASASASSRSAR